MKQSVAVIGSGIAGMASAYYLREHFDVHLYESDNYIGGHTNTQFVTEDGKDIPIDTGFMVFNDYTYPNLVRLFDELEVTSYPTSMSFGVRNDNSGLEYSSNRGKGFFAQKRRLASPNHWQLLRDIKHFFKQAQDTANSSSPPEYTIADFARDKGISDRAMNDFVIPMAGAIWSTPPAGILSFPAVPLLRFMNNHQMLGIGIQYQWKTVEGGSEQYKRKLLDKLPNKPLPAWGARKILQSENEATLFFRDGSSRPYQHVIIATHADDALRLIVNPSAQQEALLSKFKYNKNVATLHSDESVMPKARNAWASWNVSHKRNAPDWRFSTHYWMNSLQRLDTDKNYFVSVDSYQAIDQGKIHWQKEYTHPRFDAGAITAQKSLGTLNESGPVSFCGSYFRNGFHEDALWSALQAVNKLLKRKESNHELATL
ncbi:NAD(P)/FAD-dependent oxidoreductase [Pelagicoccus mobilis]|uniref:FAD-dependent oxidoreductase n=1 Tax=Pelagicoccus mobilis TaxID=415221 RepID=A0A934S0G6_9BACT|nr:FAD-dependent oxidoreductase [Pelagicoccus mobilis]MBK1880097.1 FAD-dependent oxidoreductase [Pelagicoccus mobilis]